MTTGDEADAADKPPTTGINGHPQPPLPTSKAASAQRLNPTPQNTDLLHVTPTSSIPNSSHGSLSPQSTDISPAPGKKAVFFAKPETDSGVALPAETAAEAEAVLQAIAADERSGDKSDSDNEADDVSAP